LSFALSDHHCGGKKKTSATSGYTILPSFLYPEVLCLTEMTRSVVFGFILYVRKAFTLPVTYIAKTWDTQDPKLIQGTKMRLGGNVRLLGQV